MKKILNKLLALMVMLMAVPLSGWAQQLTDYVGANGRNVWWTLDTNTGVLTINGTGDMETYNADHNGWKNYDVNTVVIGKGITKVGTSNYFGDCPSLTKLVYEEGTTTVIQAYAKQVTTVELPSTVTNISQMAFSNYTALRSINLPEGLETIGSYAFQKTKELDVVLPNTLTTIGMYAFNYNGTKILTIPASVTLIDNYAFQDCALEKIIFEGHPTLSTRSFNYLEKLNEVQIKSKTPPTNTDPSVLSKVFDHSPINNATLRVPEALYDWARETAPWSGFKEIVKQVNFNVEITNADGTTDYMELPTDVDDNVMTLTDGLKGINVVDDINMMMLTYEREFTSNTAWQSLFVPFDIEMNHVVQDLCDIAIPYMVSTKGSADGGTQEGDNGLNVLVLMKLEHGETAYANTPYFIRPKETGLLTFTFTETLLHKTADTHTLSCATSTDRYEFIGQYTQGQPDTNEAWYAMTPEGTLALGGDNSAEVGAMRWYMTKTSKNSNYPSAANARAMRIMTWGEDDEASAIVNAYVDSSAGSKQGIYSIAGVRLNKLQKGINIVNGRKVVIK